MAVTTTNPALISHGNFFLFTNLSSDPDSCIGTFSFDMGLVFGRRAALQLLRCDFVCLGKGFFTFMDTRCWFDTNNNTLLSCRYRVPVHTLHTTYNLSNCAFESASDSLLHGPRDVCIYPRLSVQFKWCPNMSSQDLVLLAVRRRSLMVLDSVTSSLGPDMKASDNCMPGAQAFDQDQVPTNRLLSYLKLES